MREATLEQYLLARVKALGGECRKLTWIGRRGAPDRLVMLHGRVIFVELKAPGQQAKPHQIREHARLRRMGQRVEVVDSFDGVDQMIGV